MRIQIFPRIIGPVLTVTIFASIIAYLWDKGYNVALPNSVVPLLSVVVCLVFRLFEIRRVLRLSQVGLILVFRNGYVVDKPLHFLTLRTLS